MLEKKDIYSIATAISALVVSMCSLFVSYRLNSRDAIYKEFMIRPILAFQEESSYSRLSLRNGGIGPALITKVYFGDKNGCHKNVEELPGRADQHKFWADFEEDFSNDFSKRYEGLRGKNLKYKISPVRGPLFPGSVIQIGQQLDFETIKVDFSGEIAYILTLPQDDRIYMWEGAFSDQVEKRSVSIEYCTISELTCWKTEMIGGEADRSCSVPEPTRKMTQ